MRHVIAIPRDLTLLPTLELVRAIRALPEADEYVFDFDALGRIEPFPMLLLSLEVAQFRAANPGARMLVQHHQKHTYAAHMGFFKAFGVDYGNSPGQAKGSKQYLPVTISSVEDINRDAATCGKAAGDIIESQAEKMAMMLTQSANGPLVDTLTYSLREIIRNVVEHSNSRQFGYCAQYWPTKALVEISILDRGIGIRSSLSGNPHLQLDSDEAALEMSVMPGISGKAYKGKRRDPNDVWANSGFGLYMTSRLCGHGGSFFILSGTAGMLLNRFGRRYVSRDFQGTALRMVMNTGNMVGLSEQLARFRDDGDAIAREYGNGSVVTASLASSMLTRDFGART